ncbi:MAG: hypothetical protein ACJASQ_001277 [Crocinitomicaceae bacterium]
MKAENENIEEFEDLIRNSSEQEEYSIQDGDWEQLQLMMNQSNRRKTIGWIWRDTVVLLLLGAWLLLGNDYSPIYKGVKESFNSIESGTFAEEEALASDTKAGASAKMNAVTEESKASDTQAGTSAKENDATEESPTSDSGVEASNRKNYSTESPSSITHAGVSVKKNTLAEESPASNTELGALGKKNDPGEEIPTLDIEVETSDKAYGTAKVVPATLVPESESKILTENPDPEPLKIDSIASNIAIEKAVNKKLHLYFGVGTEWSVASRMPVGKAKLKLQIGGEFQFLKKWSVLSGLNYTVKAYETNATDYSVAQGFWVGGIKPSSILAECNVLEIPLNVRYYFTAQDRRRSSFYLTAGASSYLMATERYRFTYDIEDPTLKQEWNGKWKNMHYFGVLHLSAGYQKSFEKNGSVLLEPYVDLPLTGIGFGQVNLMSFGMSLCVKY